jgi:hypothetical protein
MVSAILFLPFESRKKKSETSLDRFIKKSVIRNILFMPKRSRLVRKYRSGFQMADTIWKPEPKSVREMAIRKPDSPAFGCMYVYCMYHTNFLA